MDEKRIRAVLSLGGNLGDRYAVMQEALVRIGECAGEVMALSSLYESSPWGYAPQPDFLNRVTVIHTTLAEADLLDALQRIEKQMGRSAAGRWQARLIDIDILFYGNHMHDSRRLVIPHPRLAERRFVLVPLAELMPGFVHPRAGKTILQLLRACRDTGVTVRIQHARHRFAEA